MLDPDIAVVPVALADKRDPVDGSEQLELARLAQARLAQARCVRALAAHKALPEVLQMEPELVTALAFGPDGTWERPDLEWHGFVHHGLRAGLERADSAQLDIEALDLVP